MKISVLMATRDRAPLFARSIAAIAANRRPADEVVVVDQSDDDGTGRVARAAGSELGSLHYLHLERRGKTNALNRALELSSGELLALTDDDTLVDPTWLETAERLAERYPEVDAFCGRVLPETGTCPDDYINLVLEQEPRIIDHETNPVQPSVCGANLFIRRSAFLAAGRYDPLFGPGEIFRSNDDGELAYRLTRRGHAVRYSPELVVQHQGWRKETENLDLTYDYAYSLGGFAGYYLRQGDLVPALYLTRVWAWQAARLAVAGLQRRRDAIAEAWIHVSGILRGFGRGLVTRRVEVA